MKLSSAMQNIQDLSPEDKKELMTATVMFLIFTVSAVFSLMNFMWLNNPADTSVTADMPVPKVSGGGNAALNIEELVAKYDAYNKSRTYSSQLVTLAEAVGRCPITDASEQINKIMAKTPEKYEVPDVVPVITIKALVIMEGTGVATLDIEGERPGQIARSGYVFGAGKGKITSIDAGGVNWKWANKKYRTNL